MKHCRSVLHMAIRYWSRKSCDRIKGKSKNLSNPQAAKCLQTPGCCLTASRRDGPSLALSNALASCSLEYVDHLHPHKNTWSTFIIHKKHQKIQNFKTLSLASSARLSPIQVCTCACLFIAQLCTHAQVVCKTVCIPCTTVTQTGAHMCAPVLWTVAH
jgi:hypothetical protein